jgi:Transposase IS116/IS110/IS902 family
MAWHKSNPVSQRLATIPGIGPIIAPAIAATVTQPSDFRSGREFAAWLGLVPRANPRSAQVFACCPRKGMDREAISSRDGPSLAVASANERTGVSLATHM